MHLYIRPKFKGGTSVGNDGEVEGMAPLICSTDKYIYGLWTKNTQGADDSKIYLTVQYPEGKLNIVKYNLK